MAAAVRKYDKRHLTTVGLVDWSLEGRSLWSGFTPEAAAREVDFLCVHIYPASGKIKESLDTLKEFCVGKPVVIEETFPMNCSPAELKQFLRGSDGLAAGWLGFYWGKTLEECLHVRLRGGCSHGRLAGAVQGRGDVGQVTCSGRSRRSQRPTPPAAVGAAQLR